MGPIGNPIAHWFKIGFTDGEEAWRSVPAPERDATPMARRRGDCRSYAHIG
jgi:hypothetical protein